jgi:hypothetical protein
MTSFKRCIIRASSVALAVIFSAGCNSPSEPATESESPPIPSFAEASCRQWSCSNFVCGRNTYVYGACCTERGTPGVAKPSCR